MTEKEAFKVGVLSSCIERGIPLSALESRLDSILEKSAFLNSLIYGAGKISDAAQNAASGLASYGLGVGAPLALAAPPALGGLAGYTLANATDVDDTDVAEIKQRELVDEYRRQTDKLLRERKLRDKLHTSGAVRSMR